MHNDILLKVNDLRASIDGKEILKGINLEIRPGEVHAIMGPNGSGKSTLSGVLAGDPRFTVTGGSATFHGVDLLALSPENRSHEGLFLSFQYPVEIPGVSVVHFMRAAATAKRAHLCEAPPPARGAAYPRGLERRQEVVGHGAKPGCRRAYLLSYCGESVAGDCGSCGACTAEYVERDITIEAQKILSAVARVEKKYPYGLGILAIVGLLQGTRAPRARQLGLPQLPTYGALHSPTPSQIQSYRGLLRGAGVL